ncbi:HNH endonuclease [Sporosarcina globispora]|uniref:HNH endonuclease n=1 Tax=Sporosarcina globispora TaxID=1459 RepID=UPI0006A983BF|nr:HNH endonuclease [Sporosarcina globispora]
MNIDLLIDAKEKKCTDCLEAFPATEEYFYKQKTHTKTKGTFYKLSSHCKTCTKKRTLKYQQENPEKHNEAQKKYLYGTVKGRETRKRNLDKWVLNGGYKDWQQNNRDKIVEYNKDRRHKNHDITDQEWFECLDFFMNSCAYCGISENEALILYNQRLNMEHVDDDGANDITNCVPACKSCNSKKWTFELNEWYNTDNPVYSKRRYNKIIKWLLSFTKKD